jgi:hypothetical protein
MGLLSLHLSTDYSKRIERKKGYRKINWWHVTVESSIGINRQSFVALQTNQINILFSSIEALGISYKISEHSQWQVIASGFTIRPSLSQSSRQSSISSPWLYKSIKRLSDTERCTSSPSSSAPCWKLVDTLHEQFPFLSPIR